MPLNTDGYKRVPQYADAQSLSQSSWSQRLQSWTPSIRHHRLCAILTAIVLCLSLLAWLLTPLSPIDYIPIPLEKLLSDNPTPPSSIQKIDASGQYQRYDDITTVMPTKTELSPAYQRAYSFMHDHHSDIMTPTPVSSYHVTLQTVIGLVHQPSLAQFNAIVTANHRRFERLKYYFSQQTGVLTFVINNSSFPFTTFSTTVRLTPKTARDQARFDELKSTALQILGDMYVEAIPPHMGLGYRIPGRITKKDGKRQQLTELMIGLREIFDGVEVVVDMPILCVIRNMTAFPPV